MRAIIKPWTCLACLVPFDDAVSLQKHCLSVHNWGSPKDFVWTVDIIASREQDKD